MVAKWFGRLARPAAYIGAVLGALLAGCAFYACRLFHQPLFWVFPILLVHAFSVSGGMHNLIEGIPFQWVDGEGVLQRFAPPGEGQLGAEGLLMGMASIGFGLLLLMVIYLAPRLKSSILQRLLVYASIGALVHLLRQINSIHSWKVGFSHERFITVPLISGL